METSVQNEQKFFIWFWKKYYFIHKLKFSYFNSLFGNDGNNATVCETPMLNAPG